MSAGPARLRTRPAVQAADAAAERLARRRRSVRRRRLLKVGASLLAVALVVAAAWAVLASSLLAVTDVVVVGTHRATAAEVRDAAAVPMGRPLARLDLRSAERNVEQLPAVASATVTRQWPHTVRITVVERVPGSVARVDGGGYALLDPTGVDLGPVASVPPGLVVVDLDPTVTDPSLFRAAAAVAASLPAPLRTKVERVWGTTTDDLRLDLRDGDVVVWGSADDATLKAQVLKVLLGRPAHTYDVSAPLAPTTR